MSADGAHDWLGRTLDGRYRVTGTLGSGGTGVVFKASDTRLDAEVVIKVPQRMMIKDAGFAARFRREIRSLVKLSHPNIVKMMDVGEHDGLPFAVMQFLSGGSLEDRARPCTAGDAAVWLPDVAAALDFMHSVGLVHRDIKPGNILFDSSGRAYLGDFGIAKVIAEGDAAEQQLTGTGALIGTAEYMAPEMLVPSAYQETYDERVDQYALAVTLYEMLSGRPPFRGDSMAEGAVLLATKGATLIHERNAAIPEVVSRAVARALHKKPSRRYENCTAFATSFLDAVRTSSRPPPAGVPSSQRIPTGQESPSTPMPRQTRREMSRPPARRTRAETQPDGGETARTASGPLEITGFTSPPPFPVGRSASGRPRPGGEGFGRVPPQVGGKKTGSYVLIGAAAVCGFFVLLVQIVGVFSNSGTGDGETASGYTPVPTVGVSPDVLPEGIPETENLFEDLAPPVSPIPPAAGVEKTNWRDLHRKRFGDRPGLRDLLTQERAAMVASLRAGADGEFLDQDVLSAMSIIPMELFCPASQVPNLYANAPVPIGFDETISQPYISAIMLTVLQVNRGDRVLELKTGSGYQTALLAQMGAEVYSLETDRALSRVVAPTLNNLGFENLHYVVGGDGHAGLADSGSFDRIIATAAYPTTPTAILRQLKPGGRCIAPVGEVDDGQFLVLYIKSSAGVTRELKLMEVAFGSMPR